MKNMNTKPRCPYELIIEEYYGFDPTKVEPRRKINTDFGDLVSLVCFANQKFKDWISVEDRLPELTEPLIGYNDENIREVFIENFEVTVLGYNKDHGIFKARLTKHGWAEISSVSVNSTIKPTHWQPLLNPPKQ